MGNNHAQWHGLRLQQHAMRAGYTSKPSARKHLLWASITSAHLSSPLSTIHSSRAFFVSGHEQHIFLPDLPSFGPGCAGCGAAGCSLLLAFPILRKEGVRAWSCVRARALDARNLLLRGTVPGTGRVGACLQYYFAPANGIGAYRYSYW